MRNSSESDPKKWKSCKDIQTLLHPLKVEGDKPLPTWREDIINRYKEYEHRRRREVDEDIVEEFWLSKAADDNSQGSQSKPSALTLQTDSTETEKGPFQM